MGVISGICKVCGESVLYVLADLHIEEHRQRGEVPQQTFQKGQEDGA